MTERANVGTFIIKCDLKRVYGCSEIGTMDFVTQTIALSKRTFFL